MNAVFAKITFQTRLRNTFIVNLQMSKNFNDCTSCETRGLRETGGGGLPYCHRHKKILRCIKFLNDTKIARQKTNFAI